MVDVEELLRLLRAEREAVRAVQSRTGEDGDLSDADRNVLLDAAEAMAEYVGNLDQWLSRGGYLPRDWSHR